MSDDVHAGNEQGGPGSKAEPAPISILDDTAVWPMVIQDMLERDAMGRAKYGRPLHGFNGRRAIVDAFQESLDLVVYLRQKVFEDEGLDAIIRSALASLEAGDIQSAKDFLVSYLKIKGAQ